METFAGLLLEDGLSYLRQDPLWKPKAAEEKPFGMRQLIDEALEYRPEAGAVWDQYSG